jgi:hypothetical protein
MLSDDLIAKIVEVGPRGLRRSMGSTANSRASPATASIARGPMAGC